ncbi:Error-prone DNA polymerase [Anatilimnocola aggregata]|uniref:Error-prone DNA polymerase n=1 Tax=Anatilimnocola aggregata TaxID=2528021 RepID=A0A517YCM8_9BACT|nr:error-prone DNA polymerase [Anatilimnocola aggregata]QDU27994.1 Error-prone DNA polymerase [Anatilimnocola aggregata]
MPEHHDDKRIIRLTPPSQVRPGNYAELHCKTNFSFLEGASHPDELVNRAAELSYAALAITDRNSLAGVVRAHGAAKQVGLKLLIGAEIVPIDAAPLVLLATDRPAYSRLSQLITLGRRKAPKGECHLTFDDVARHAAGLLACVIDQHVDVFRYREVFADRCYLLAELHYGTNDEHDLQHALRLAKRANTPLVAAGGVHFHTPERRPLADVLTAIRAGCTVTEAAELLLPNAERHLKSPEQMEELFAHAPEAVRRTLEIAARCTFSLDELKYEYPEELSPPGQSLPQYLAHLTWNGAQQRYPAGLPEKVEQQIHYELQLINQLHYEAYFLTVWDLVRFARERGILCQGRGSAANSVVCYCLGVTAVDPDRIDVLFERFISAERDEAPDIDIDFEHERREEVLQYLYDKYGRERAGIVAEVITYRPRSAVRDVGKALGLSLDKVDKLAKHLDSYHAEKMNERLVQAGLDHDSLLGSQLFALAGELIGFPRHLGQHVGGMVITQRPLWELVPIENAAMPGRTVIEWDKNDLDELGLLKVDCLSLGMLTAIRKCFALIEQATGRALTLADIPEGDTAVYTMISRADTMGVFQIESRAQMSMLPRLRPECFYDLVIEVAIVRPGPIQGNMVHPYLRRRTGEEAITYPSEEIGKVLQKTLGVPLFQEQAMRLAVVAAGFTPGEADELRRAMGSWRKTGVIERFGKKLIDGMTAKGLSTEFAERVFNQIKGFGEYGFPESHAASFALLVYASAWLKHHYPAAFCASLINSQPMGFYAPAQLVRNARENGVKVLPVDVNHSEWDCTLEAGAMRLGLRTIAGLSATVVSRIAQARPFCSVTDFTERTELGVPVVKLLADADAFHSLQLDRRQALWQSLAQEPKKLPLLAGLADEEDVPSELPAMSGLEQVLADYRTQGLSLRAHPLSFFRDEMQSLQITPAAELSEKPDGTSIKVAGLVLVRQRPSTAKGITFVTLEDETGVANLIIRVEVWDRYYKVARTAAALIATGRLQNQREVIHVLVTKLENLAGRVGGMKSQSRDFH